MSIEVTTIHYKGYDVLSWPDGSGGHWYWSSASPARASAKHKGWFVNHLAVHADSNNNFVSQLSITSHDELERRLGIRIPSSLRDHVLAGTAVPRFKLNH